MDLNKANVGELAQVVGLASAYDLVLWRPYLSWEEVACVPGFDDERRLHQLRVAGYKLALPDKVCLLRPPDEHRRDDSI